MGLDTSSPSSQKCVRFTLLFSVIGLVLLGVILIIVAVAQNNLTLYGVFVAGIVIACLGAVLLIIWIVAGCCCGMDWCCQWKSEEEGEA